MSQLSNLMGKSKVYKIGGIELEIKPRTLKDLDIVIGLQDESTRVENMKKLISSTLRDSVPDATEEEIETISFKYFKELSEAIVDVNGLNDTNTN